MGTVLMGAGGGGVDTSGVTAGASDILSGKVVINANGDAVTGTVASQGATTHYFKTSQQTAVASGKYISGNQTIKALTQTGIAEGNIKSGVTISVSNGSSNVFSKTGTFGNVSSGGATAAQILSGKKAYVNASLITGTMATVAGTTIPFSSAQQTFSCSGKKVTGNVIVQKATNLVASNIKSGVTILGVKGNYYKYSGKSYYIAKGGGQGSSSQITFASGFSMGSSLHKIAGDYNVYIAPLTYPAQYQTASGCLSGTVNLTGYHYLKCSTMAETGNKGDDNGNYYYKGASRVRIAVSTSNSSITGGATSGWYTSGDWPSIYSEYTVEYRGSLSLDLSGLQNNKSYYIWVQREYGLQSSSSGDAGVTDVYLTA